jgi:glutamyl-tRNA reductase
VDRIGVVGTSYRKTDIEQLGRAALPAGIPGEHLVEMARLAGFTEFVYLGTCNRVEFYFRSETRLHTNQLLFHLRRSLADLTRGETQLPDRDQLYVHFGRPAVQHLFRVTAALDSMMVGEAQIAGQAKEAHERAHELGLLSGILDQTFHESFHLAKRIRTETDLARRPVSLVTLVERRLRDHLDQSAAPVAIVGAGEMAGQALRLVRQADPTRRVVVANRTIAKAERLAAGDANARVRALDDFLDDPPLVGLVVAATGADHVVLDRDHVLRLRSQLPTGEPLLLIDLAMPPNIAPDVADDDDLELRGIEQMREEAESNRRLREAEMSRCEAMVDHQVDVLRRHILDRALSPAARAMKTSFDEMAEKALERSFRKQFAHLEDEDRAAMEKMVKGLTKRLVQVPLQGLKSAAWNHSSAVLDNFLKGVHGDELPMSGNGDGR